MSEDLSDQISKARTTSELEAVARALSVHDDRAKLIGLFRARLNDLSVDLPERILAYAERIITGDQPLYEELHKVFSLTESLACLASLGIGGARERLQVLSEYITQHAHADARYDMVRADIYGAGYPIWWNANA